MLRGITLLGVLGMLVGCNTLGISVSPPQNRLTEQVEGVVNRSTNRAAIPKELEMSVIPAHYLQPGDGLLIEPVKLDSSLRVPADQRVMADGTVDLSPYGRVIVAGLTLEQAEALIEQTIERLEDEEVVLNVRLIDPVHRIYVLGEVASPGAYPFIGNETVLDGILTAGGLTTRANPCKIILARPTPADSCRVALPICYREITQLGDTTTNYQLQPGDRIFVASRTFMEDLHFWKANQTCDRCCRCQYPCADPGTALYDNPISPALPPGPALPLIESDAENDVSTEAMIEERTESPSPPLPPIRQIPPPRVEPQPIGPEPGQLQFDQPL